MEARDILFWIFFALSMAVVVWLIVGDSPTFEQAILVLILTLLIKSSIEIKGLAVKVGHLENSFKALATDFKEHIKHKK